MLLRMAADQERADRIRALKQGRPDLTWRRIAEHVGVTERSATDWQTKGGISYENAKRLAALFEVDVDYVWRGTETDTPDPFADADGTVEDRLARLEAMLAQGITEQDRMSSLIDQQNQLLQRQSKILDGIEELMSTQLRAARQMEEAAAEMRAETERRQSPRSTSRRSGRTAS